MGFHGSQPSTRNRSLKNVFRLAVCHGDGDACFLNRYERLPPTAINNGDASEIL
jgi:hypothetical protein